MVDFRLILLLFPGKFLVCLKYLSGIQEASDETFQQATFPALTVWSPNSYCEPIVVFDK